MQTTVIATALLATLGVVQNFASTSSEPVGLLMWGGSLLLLSVALRLGFARRLESSELVSRQEAAVQGSPSLTQPAQG
jgi:hypothetical protein